MSNSIIYPDKKLLKPLLNLHCFGNIFAMLKIRLQRVGRKHDPSFRIVLTDSKNGPKSGKFLEILGNYDPKKDIKVVDGDRVKELMSTGAQVSDTVHNILVSEKVIEGKKINVLPKKSPIVKEKTEEEKAEAPTEEGGEEVKEEIKEEVTEETKTEEETPAEVKEENKEEKPTEEVKEEAPAEEAPKEEEKPVEETEEKKEE